MSSPKKLIALSFDDGPAERTDDVLALLAEYDAISTFFVLGCQVEGREPILERVAEAGHELGNHTFSHPDLGALEPKLIEDELVRTSDAIDEAVGVRPSQLGMSTVLWSLDPRDWEGAQSWPAHAPEPWCCCMTARPTAATARRRWMRQPYRRLPAMATAL